MKIINKVVGNKVDIVLDVMLPADPAKNYVPKLVYNIVLHDTDIIVGKCDARIGANENTFLGGNIGYGIMPKYQNNGYATEAVMLLLKVFKANKMHTVYICNAIDNIASQKVCKHIGATNLGKHDIPRNSNMYTQSGQTEEYIWQVDI